MKASPSPPSQRPVAIAIIVLANLLLMMGPVLCGFAAPGLFRWPIPLMLIAGGIVVGQLLWITLWASLSDARVVFRWGLLCGAVCVANLGIALLPHFVQLWYGATLQATFAPFRRELIMQAFLRDVPPCLAFALATYAILLPYRRLRGISVGTVPIDKSSDSRSHQFRIIDLMIFSLIVAAPLALIRRYSHGEQLPTFVLFFTLLTAGGLLFGVPVFVASLAGRRAILWTPLSICFVLVVAWIFTECTFWMYGSAGGLAADFRVWGAVLLPAATVICLNNFCLQALGIRLLQRRFATIAPSEG